MNTLISAYENYFIELRHLPTSVKNSTRELVFSYRNGIESICLVLSNVENLSTLVPKLPKDFFENNYYRYAVDLDSIGQDKIRVYRDDNSPLVLGIGQYINNEGEVLETKIYKKTENKTEIFIDRYDSQNTLISSNEKEITILENEWRGNPLVTLVAKQNQFHIIYLKKVDKDQFYARIRNI